MELATTIKRLRANAELDVAEAAGRAKVSVSYWQKLEAGQMRNPTVAVLRRVAITLSVSPADLIEAAATV